MLDKIFSVEQIRVADQYTIDHEPIASIDLMERAANECFVWLKQKAKKSQSFTVLCGPGNNGGDGLAIARMLAEDHFPVQVFILNLSDRFSADFMENRKRIMDVDHVHIHQWDEVPQEMPIFRDNTIVIDAIFGSGLSKEIKGMPQKLIRYLNEQPQIKVAIDIPSGLFADKAINHSSAVVFQADYTLSFQFPKWSFLMPENEKYVGDWQILDIGLSREYIEKTPTEKYYMSTRFVKSLLKPRGKFSHKGHFGHVLMVAGDETKMGAAILSSKAALRMGAGLLTLHHPQSAKSILPIALPEAMLSLDSDTQAFSRIPELEKYTHIAVGPGLGTRKQTAKALKMLIQQAHSPMLLDADALNILAENKTWLSFLPKASILTPHIGEFHRLVGQTKNSFERIEKALSFAKKYQIYLIVKGAYTMIFTPSENIYVNSTGNPGMATGGSGDVLTGMIAGLLAQQYSSLEAALIGVFMHGLAGDMAAKELSMESLMAGDIIQYIPAAYKALLS